MFHDLRREQAMEVVAVIEMKVVVLKVATIISCDQSH
jgi:hypothetical protein